MFAALAALAHWWQSRCVGDKGPCWHIRVGPVLDGIGGHVVVDEHAEAQIDEGLLKLMKRLLLG